MKYISEFVVTLSTVIGMLIYLIFSLLGIEHTEENPSPYFAAIIVAVNLYAIGWIMMKEVSSGFKGKGNLVLYVVVPAFVIMLYYVEQLNPEVVSSSDAQKMFIQWGAQCVAPFYVALYTFRHNRFDMLTKNLEVIMLLGSVSLILNIPKIILLGKVQLGGGGGHQDIAYSAGFFICILLTYLYCGLEEYRFKIFTKSFFRIIEIALIPILVLIVLMSGGRGGALLMIVGAIVCSYMFARKHAKKYFFIIAAVVIVGAIGFSRSADSGLMNMVGGGMDRSFNYISGGEIKSEAGDRDWIYEDAREIIGDSPIIGHGIFGGYAEMYKIIGGYSHNIFYDLLIHGGIVYFIFVLVYIVRAYRSAYRLIKYDKSKAILLSYGLYICVMLMFSGTYFVCSQFWFFVTFSLLNQRESWVLYKNKNVMKYA